MRDIVKTIAKAQCVPEAFVAYPALSHGAAAIGNSVEAKCYLDGGAEPAILWTGVIADSGVGKTEVLKKLRYPFEGIDKDYSIAYQSALAQHQQNLKDKIGGVAPTEKHLLIMNATMEAIFDICSKNPHGLLLPEAEGKLFFSFDSYRNGKTDEANYCKLYDRDYFKVNRRGGATISGVGILNLAMMIQPGNFRKTLIENPGMKTSGLLARMNLCYPAVGDYRIAGRVDSTAYQNWDEAITDIIERRTDDGTPVTVCLDDRAQAKWDGYMTGNRNYARRTGGWLGGYYDRLHVTAVRIALQTHCSEDRGGIMNLETIERGIAIAEYMKSENERVVSLFSGGEESVDKEAEAILTKIRELGGGAKVRDVVLKMAKYRPAGGSEALTKKLDEMVLAGKLTRHFEPGGNNQSVAIYSLVTLVTSNTLPENAGE
jgi:hypothetical protein